MNPDKDILDGGAPRDAAPAVAASAGLRSAIDRVARHQAARERHLERAVRYHATPDRRADLNDELHRRRESDALAITNKQMLMCAVRAFVAELRASNVPPERMLTLLTA